MENQYQESIIDQERRQKVVRSAQLIQKAQYSLTLQEQRFLLYSISKIKPEDDETTSYVLELKDYLKVCGLGRSANYQRIKKSIADTFSKMTLFIEEDNGSFTVTSWFDFITVTPQDGTVTYKFSSKIAKHLIGLARYNKDAAGQQQVFYVSDELRYMLPFSSRYSYYLYPLIRSYRNLTEWTFKLEYLRAALDAYKNSETAPREDREILYPRWPDFRRYVLDPAIKDINDYSNIKISYKAEKKGSAVDAVTFYFEDKNDSDICQAQIKGDLILDKENVGKVTVLSTMLHEPTEIISFEHASPVGKTSPPSRKNPVTSRKPKKKEAWTPSKPKARGTMEDIREIIAKETEENLARGKVDFGKRKYKNNPTNPK